MIDDKTSTTVDGPPKPANGPGRGSTWVKWLAEARTAYPKWVRVGPYADAASAATAKRAAAKGSDEYEITSRTEDGGKVWVYIHHCPRAVES